MLIGLFCRLKTLVITASNKIVETHLQKNGYLFSISRRGRILTGAKDSPHPPPLKSDEYPFGILTFLITVEGEGDLRSLINTILAYKASVSQAFLELYVQNRNIAGILTC